MIREFKQVKAKRPGKKLSDLKPGTLFTFHEVGATVDGKGQLYMCCARSLDSAYAAQVPVVNLISGNVLHVEDDIVSPVTATIEWSHDL